MLVYLKHLFVFGVFSIGMVFIHSFWRLAFRRWCEETDQMDVYWEGMVRFPFKYIGGWWSFEKHLEFFRDRYNVPIYIALGVGILFYLT